MREVAIVGAGIAGLVCALELAGRGCRVTVVDDRYPGGGNSGRNVGRVRRVQLTEDLARFACAACDAWDGLDRLLGRRNPLLLPTTYAMVLYDADEVAALRPLEPMWREVGARARVAGAAEVLDAIRVLRGGERPAGAVLGAASLVHHDAAVHGAYLRAREVGVDVRHGVRAERVETTGGAVSGLVLADGSVLRCDAVVNAADSRAGDFARRSGLVVPNVAVRREALVTAPVRPLLDHAVTFYRPQEGWFNQTLRGEVVAGVIDPDEPTGFDESSSLAFLARTAAMLVRKAPALAGLEVIRQWAGTYDITPDKRPMLGAYGPAGLYALHGWSGRGIALGPLGARLVAREICGDGVDPLAAPFAAARYDGVAATAEVPGDYYAGYSH